MSILVRRYGDTDFITGLRAIAAVMVIAIHTAAFRDFGPIGDIVTDNGKYGVQIFFVISGFTVARTYRGAGRFGPYFGRRLLRITPLYYAAILTAFLLIATQTVPTPRFMSLYDSAPDAYNLLMHLSFLSAFDARVANSLLEVEWSIPIEIFWYAVLPALLPLPQSRKRLVAVFGALLLLSGLTRAAAHVALPAYAAHFLPFSYGAYFYLGALAERLRPRMQDRPPSTRRKATWAASALFLAGLITDTGFNAAILALATAGLIACRPGGAGRRGLLCLGPMLFLGSISYSLYLTHPLVLHLTDRLPALTPGAGLAHFALVLGLTTALSALTYMLIEYPSNRLGRRLFGHGPAHAAPAPLEPDRTA